MMRFLLPFIVLLAVLSPAPGQAAGSITASVTAVKLYRGTTVIISSDPASTTYRANFTPDACRTEKAARGEAEAKTRTSGTVQYKCQIEERDTWTFKAAAPCPSPPPDQTRPGTCPAGTEGSWTQTGTTTFGPAPDCAPTVTWRPVTPPEGACTPIPPPALPAPSGVTATAVSASEILVKWNVVADALAYSVRRCIGASCDPLSVPALRCTAGLEQRHVTLPAGTTVRYQVQAARTADCTGDLSPASMPIVAATTLAGSPTPPAEQPPSACVGRVCTMNFTPGAPVADAPVAGFRLVYGRAPDQLVKSVQVNDPAARSIQATVDASGVWFFATIAFTATGRDSLVSNVLSRTVP
jgi:hypothetical protein